jgi:hypothetical protein
MVGKDIETIPITKAEAAAVLQQ